MDQQTIAQLKRTVRELKTTVKHLNIQVVQDGKTIKQLQYEKSVVPKMDGLMQNKMLEKEYQLKYEKIRDENITLKAIQLKQTNALLELSKTSKDKDVKQLMNELRHTKEKNLELQFAMKKQEKVSTELINANANLKKELRKIRNKRINLVGNFATELTHEQSGNKHDYTISELEQKLEANRKGRAALVNKHMNFKIKAERTIERLSLMLRTQSLKTS